MDWKNPKMETQTEANHMCLMLTPHLSVCVLQAAKDSHLVTSTKDEYVRIGSYRIMRRRKIHFSLSEYYLPKSAFVVIDARVLDKICQPSLETNRQSFSMGKKFHSSMFPTGISHIQ